MNWEYGHGKRDLDELDLTSGGVRNFLCHLIKGQHPWPGDFINLSVMAIFGQCRDSDICYVIYVDKRFWYVRSWQGDCAVKDHTEKLSFREILVEPAGANHGPFDASLLNDAFAKLGFLLTTAGQQYEALDTDEAAAAAWQGRHNSTCVG